MENDLKKLLAYSSVENIGVILFGLGLAMLYTSLKLPGLAALALITGLYHLINHAAFKGLLFLCAGSVQKGCRTLDLEKLGGLIKKMPWTAGFFLIGALGIAALPPLNGFVSEWLLFHSFFSGLLKVSGVLALGLALSAATLALTSGLAAACFVKAFGITFLALPRNPKAEQAQEAPASMLLGMFLLALAVAGLALGAPLVFNLLARVAEPICLVALPATNPLILTLPASGNLAISPFLIASWLVFFWALVATAYRILVKKPVRLGRTWDCGYYQVNSHNEYTSTAFSKPFRISFSFFLLPFRKTEKIKDSFYHIKSFVYETYTTKVFQKYFYDLLIGWLYHNAKLFKKIQAGSIHLYLSYILATLITLIFLVRII